MPLITPGYPEVPPFHSAEADGTVHVVAAARLLRSYPEVAYELTTRCGSKLAPHSKPSVSTTTRHITCQACAHAERDRAKVIEAYASLLAREATRIREEWDHAGCQTPAIAREVTP